jgi:hypothetical protein
VLLLVSSLVLFELESPQAANENTIVAAIAAAINFLNLIV